MIRAATARAYSTAAKANKIGFIGLGNMGRHMAANLLKAGYPLTVHDMSADAVNSLVAKGAKAAESPEAVADGADTVITMLPSNPHVLEVYTGAKGVLKTVKSGALLLDASTIDPAVAKQVAAAAAAKHARFCDAPVSGGVGGAEAGTLTFMVGGDAAHFSAAQPILSSMGKNIVHCGAVGTGQAAKICNNMLLGICMIGTSEAMNLGVQMGVDPKLLASIINTSSGRNWSSEIYNPCPGVVPTAPANRGYTGGFGAALMSKDLGLALAAATSAKAPVPLGALAAEIYKLMSASGYAGKDFSSVYEFLNGGAHNIKK